MIDMKAPFHPNMIKAVRKIKIFITRMDSPTEMVVLLEISNANTSVPSNAPPFRRTIPIPIPSSKLPMKISNKKFPSTNAEDLSIIAVEIVNETIPNVARKANRFPRCLRPIRTNGIFNMNNTILSEKPYLSDSIIEIPVIPPSIKPFGISITSRLIAVITAPMMIHGILKIRSKK